MRSLRLFGFLAGAVLFGACTNPQREAQLLSEMQAMGDAINETRSYVSDLEARVDSLVNVIARHDTATTRLAEFTGVQIPKSPY